MAICQLAVAVAAVCLELCMSVGLVSLSACTNTWRFSVVSPPPRRGLIYFCGTTLN